MGCIVKRSTRMTYFYWSARCLFPPFTCSVFTYSPVFVCAVECIDEHFLHAELDKIRVICFFYRVTSNGFYWNYCTDASRIPQVNKCTSATWKLTISMPQKRTIYVGKNTHINVLSIPIWHCLPNNLANILNLQNRTKNVAILDSSIEFIGSHRIWKKCFIMQWQ